MKTKAITRCRLHAWTPHHCWLSVGQIWHREVPLSKNEKMATIEKVLNEFSIEYPVFYGDKVDIYPNPKSAQTGNFEDSING